METRTTTDKISITKYGDVELWLAKAADETWCLPLFVQWNHDKDNDLHYGWVEPAVGTYKSQQLTLIALLQFHDIAGRQDKWLIERKMVEALLFRAPGLTPRYYYRWPDENMPPLPVASKVSLPTTDNSHVSFGTARESFVKHICSTYGLPNSVVRIVLRAIGAEGPKWMLTHRRELDLGFCKMVAAPFRPNWKEIITAKYRKWNLLTIFNKPSQNNRKELEEAGLPEALCSPENIGLKKGSTKCNLLHYTLEVIPGRQFENAVNVIEAERRACGSLSYVASFEKTVEAIYGHLLEALENYLHKTQAPFARVSEGGAAGVLRFLPTVGNAVKVHGVGIRRLPVYILENVRKFSVFGESRDKTIVRPKALKMSEMPPLLSATPDLRGCPEQGNVVEPRQEGAAWVPLYYEDKGSTAGQPVLPEPETPGGSAPRLD